MADKTFIGLANVQSVANKLEPNIIMGPAYYQREDLDRLGIKVVTGVQYKNTEIVLAKKGGTTRRKKLDEDQTSKLGYFIERELVAHILINRKVYNEDKFQERPGNIAVSGSAQTFPVVEEFIKGIGEVFSDDVFANLFNGAEDSDDETMNFFDGYNTIINKDIENGVISIANKNLIPTGVFDGPQTEGDASAYIEWRDWYLRWSAPLKRAKSLCYCPTDVATAIADAYEQMHRSHQTPVYEENGNFKLPAHPKVTFVPTDEFGKGTRIFATIEGNLEFGVNSEDDQSFVSVEKETSIDNKNLAIQIQMIAGCRIANPLASAFVTNGGTVEDSYASSDYLKDAFYASANDSKMGTVAIKNGQTDVESGTEVAKGTPLTLTATAETGYEFVKWSNGSTANPTSVVTTGDPQAITALFKKSGE